MYQFLSYRQKVGIILVNTPNILEAFSVGMLQGLCEKLPIYGNVEKKGKREADGGIAKSRPKASKCLHYSLQMIVE